MGWSGRSAEGRRRVEIGGWRQGRRLEAVEGGKGLERAWRSAGSQRREEGWRQKAGDKGAGWSAGWSAGWRLKAGAQVGAPEPAQARGWKGDGTNQPSRKSVRAERSSGRREERGNEKVEHTAER